MSDNAAMEAEIQGLNEANDRLRERLNRSENHDGYMKLPLDADGVPIRIGDEMWLQCAEGEEPLKRIVIGYRASSSGESTLFIGKAEGKREGTCCAQYWSHKKPEPSEDEPPDSWEKLEKDVYHAVMTDFIEDPEGEVRDLIRRAKEMVG